MSKQNDEKFKQIRLAWDNGSTVEQIAKQFDYKLSSVKATLNKLGISFAKDYTNQKEVCRKMRIEGKSLKEMSAVTGLSECTISTYLVKMGLKSRRIQDRGVDLVKIDESKLIYAEKVDRSGKPYTDFNSGKKYTEVNESLFQLCDIQSIKK